MPNNLDSGFGGNIDSVLGSATPLGNKQTGLGDFRARSFYSGAAGARITAVLVTPRDGIAAPGAGFPAAGMFTLVGMYGNNQIDPSSNFQFPDDYRKFADSIFLHSSRSTLENTAIIPPEGFHIPPNKWAHIIVTTPVTSAGAGLATIFDLTVLGHNLPGDTLPFKLR